MDVNETDIVMQFKNLLSEFEWLVNRGIISTPKLVVDGYRKWYENWSRAYVADVIMQFNNLLNVFESSVDNSVQSAFNVDAVARRYRDWYDNWCMTNVKS